VLKIISNGYQAAAKAALLIADQWPSDSSCHPVADDKNTDRDYEKKALEKKWNPLFDHIQLKSLFPMCIEDTVYFSNRINVRRYSCVGYIVAILDLLIEHFIMVILNTFIPSSSLIW
jgi:hypothetical protein